MKEHPDMSSEDGTLTIIESNPPYDVDWTGVRAIVIDIDKENFTARPRLPEINRLIESIPNPDAIAGFTVGYDSRLTALPNLRPLRKISALTLGGKLKSYDDAFRLQEIDTLFLVNYKRPDFSDFQPLVLSDLRLIRGRVERICIEAQSALLQSCSKLESLSGSSINVLDLGSIHGLDLSTLGDITGLEKLSLSGCKCVDNLDFLARCSTLKHLVITATKLNSFDFSPLKQAARLETLFLDTRTPAVLQGAARANSEIMVTNGETVFWQGHEHPIQAYWDTET